MNNVVINENDTPQELHGKYVKVVQENILGRTASYDAKLNPILTRIFDIIEDEFEIQEAEESELTYSIPYNIQTYENFIQYDDVCPNLLNKNTSRSDLSLRFEPSIKNAKPEDFKKPIPDSQLLSTDNIMYKTPYYDINTTYQPITLPNKIDERLIESRGSLLDTGSNTRSSSTDYWLLQTALNIDGSIQL